MKPVWMLSGIALVILTWYLFIRSHEFEVNFIAKTLPGDIIQTLRIWDRSLDSAKIVGVDSLYGLTQQIVWKERSYLYKWNFQVVNDSTTDVNIEISQPARSLLNKLLVPVTDQHIEQDAREIARQFYDVLNMHLKITSVKVVGERDIAPAFCVCRTLETNQIDKAKGMMREYGLLTSFISESGLKPNGPPIVRIRSWDHTLGKLKFDFCFPIIKREPLPLDDSVDYTEFPAERALGAVYHGNYITSDRAWYTLMNFATANGYEINGLPIEYFYNNPTLGINEKEWKAEIFLPIK
jgi:hypothetical protein